MDSSPLGKSEAQKTLDFPRDRMILALSRATILRLPVSDIEGVFVDDHKVI